ncbi:unnamed protein product [Enterobius vermicularis]|uniref:B12-binding domain-containing protein n=1 Tax=Enterobius vermicularis TaxID=51028 RepID=A0A0N4V5B6_ENTVE|nr:unnamed protein product [Enterobius vermicularis]
MLPAILNNARRGTSAFVRSISSKRSTAEMNEKSHSRSLMARVTEFAEKEGRQPRILIAKMGQGGNDPETMHLATSFADFGFDVDLGPSVQTPEEVARHAIDSDVHAVGVRNVAVNHLTLIPTLVSELKKLGRPDIPVIVACDVPFKDHEKLYGAGVASILSSASDITERASKVLYIIFYLTKVVVVVKFILLHCAIVGFYCIIKGTLEFFVPGLFVAGVNNMF